MVVLMSRVRGRAGVSPEGPYLAGDSCVYVSSEGPTWLGMVVWMSRVCESAGVCPEGPCLARDGCVDV